MKGCTKIVEGSFHDLLTFVVNFELLNWEMEWGNCDCSVKVMSSSIISFGCGSEINVILMAEKLKEN